MSRAASESAGPGDPKIEADLTECERRCTAFGETNRPLFATPGALTRDGREDELVALRDEDGDGPGAEHGAGGLGEGVEHHAATSTLVAVR